MNTEDIPPISKLGMSAHGLREHYPDEYYTASWTVARTAIMALLLTLFLTPMLNNMFGVVISVIALGFHLYLLKRYYDIGMEACLEYSAPLSLSKPLDDLM